MEDQFAYIADCIFNKEAMVERLVTGLHKTPCA
jgi:hypothetical protein